VEHKLTGLLKTGTKHLSPSAVRQIIRVAGERAMGSLEAIYRLDEEARELAEYYSSEDPIKQAEDVVRAFEDDKLEWEQQRTDYADSDAEAESDSEWELMGEELLDALGQAMVEAEVTAHLEKEPIQGEWAQDALQQATWVSYMALGVCDYETKADWDP
jgi:hypothetical protein